jgi:DNA-binding response OmpR family regulator
MTKLVETRSSKDAEGRAVARRGFTRGRILVVDDDAALLGVIAAGLAYAGFDVVEASDGIDALAAMYARRPGVMLVDLAMPRMNGVELIAQVCTEPTFQGVAVVAMSGNEGLLRRATEAGAGATLVKPLSIPSVIAALHLHKRRAASAS